MAHSITSHEPDLPKMQGQLLYRFQHAMRGGYGHMHPRLLIARLALKALPPEFGNYGRATLLRWAGFRIGRSTVVLGAPRLVGRGNVIRRLTIGEGCMINTNCLLDLNADITICDRVGLGHDVMILTATHDIGAQEQRVGETHALPVTIGPGAWVGARVVVLPGVTIGAGAIISAGSVVSRDLPPNTMFAGVPARLVQHLS